MRAASSKEIFNCALGNEIENGIVMVALLALEMNANVL